MENNLARKTFEKPQNALMRGKVMMSSERRWITKGARRLKKTRGLKGVDAQREALTAHTTKAKYEFSSERLSSQNSGNAILTQTSNN